MICILSIDQFICDYLFFIEPIKNIILKNGVFVKFFYSDNNCIMNNIYINFPYIPISKPILKNYKIPSFDVSFTENIYFLQHIYNLEHSILNHYMNYKNSINTNITVKKRNYLITEAIQNNTIRFQNITVKTFFVPKYTIKISGIWENENEYGINYKFIIHSSFSTGAPPTVPAITY